MDMPGTSCGKRSRSESDEDDCPQKQILLEPCSSSSDSFISWFRDCNSCSSLASSSQRSPASITQRSPASSTQRSPASNTQPEGPTEQGTQRNESLRAAVVSMKLDEVRAAIEGGASVNALIEGETPLTAICGVKPTRRHLRSEQIEIINMLLECGASASGKNHKGHTPLHLARTQEVVTLLLQKGACVHDRSSSGETPLIMACRLRRSVDIIATLLEWGSSPDAQDYRFKSPLHVATYSAMNLLLKKCTVVNVCDDLGETPLFNLCRRRKCPTEAITKLLEHGAIINWKNMKGRTPLHAASSSSLPETVELLLSKGANVNELDDDGETPLFGAARKRSATDDTIKILLLHGAWINHHNNRGKTPLHVSLFSATVLLENGASPDDLDINGESPLFNACRERCTADGLIDALLAGGASVNISNPKGDTPLHVACAYLQFDTVNILLSAGALPNAINAEGDSPIFAAVKKRRCPPYFVHKLVGGGADINQKNSLEQTPLHVACMKGSLAIVEKLLKLGATVDATDNQQATPLLLACKSYCYRTELIRMLISHGASLNATTSDGVTLIHYLCERNKLSLARTLLAKGALVNGIDANGNTPLAVALKHQSPPLIKLLLDHGAIVNRKNNLGKTPLLIACTNPSKRIMSCEIIRMLLRFGADPNEPDSEGNMPLQVAPPGPVTFLLLEFGAKIQYATDKKQVSDFLKLIESVKIPLVSSFLLNKKVGNTNYSFRDCLLMRIHRADYERFMEEVYPEDFDHACGEYANLLTCSYLKIKRLALMEYCCGFSTWASLPYLPAELEMLIFSFLDVADVCTLLRTMEIPFPSRHY